MTKTKFERSEFRLPTPQDIVEKIRFVSGDFHDEDSKRCARLCLHAAYDSTRAPETNVFFQIYAWYCKGHKIPEKTAGDVLEHLMEWDLIDINGRIIWPYLNGVAQ